MSTPYVPNVGRQDAFVTTMPPTVSVSQRITGTGSPEGIVPGKPGQAYVDSATNDLWVKFAGVQELGWKLVGKALPVATGGGTVTGDTQVFSGTGSPEGVITPTTDTAIYFRLDATTGFPDGGEMWSYYSGAWH
jgi:hypothetical protein